MWTELCKKGVRAHSRYTGSIFFLSLLSNCFYGFCLFIQILLTQPQYLPLRLLTLKEHIERAMSPFRLYYISVIAQEGASPEHVTDDPVLLFLWSQSDGICFGLHKERSNQEKCLRVGISKYLSTVGPLYLWLPHLRIQQSAD